MLILSIETSCDETGLALIEASGGLKSPKFKIIKNLLHSQIKIHRPFGGVVPNLAKREHLKNLPMLFKNLYPGHYTLYPNLIAVTVGPGLEPALWTGINFAEEIRKKYFSKTRLIGTNHLEGHLFSFLLAQKTSKSKIKNQKSKLLFPAIALIVSGGHTILLLMKDLTHWKKLGETRDDAAGEAFDKVARLLGLPYPGGPEIEKLAGRGDSHAIDFPRPMLNQKNYDFSFSGLKTSVFYYLRDTEAKRRKNIRVISRKDSHKSAFGADIAASFQEAVIDVLTRKTIRAAKEFRARSIILCGGVAANKALRKRLKTESSGLKISFLVPDAPFNTDNAAMIAAAGYFAFLKKKKKLPLAANGNLGI